MTYGEQIVERLKDAINRDDLQSVDEIYREVFESSDYYDPEYEDERVLEKFTILTHFTTQMRNGTHNNTRLYPPYSIR